MITARELRARAREALGFKIFGGRWMYALLACLLISIISSVIGTIPFAGAVIIIILTGPLTMGLANYFRSMCENREEPNSNVENLFGPMKNDLGGSIVTGLLVTIFQTLWILLLIIPGIIKYYSYSMTYYIKLDHPEYTPTQAITESRRMMNGNKFRLFCLELSFIGWYFVGALACGIGILWVEPYAHAAKYEFYRELKFNDNAQTGDFS